MRKFLSFLMASLLSVTMYAADAKFYITGDSALVVDAGLTKDKAWNANAIKSEKDTFVLSLKANQDYLLKVAVDGTWEGGQVKGYNELSEKPEGLKDVSNDHNIGFRLNQAGEVKVIYKAGEPEVFKVLGDFYVEVPAKFYVTGDTALVVAAGVDKTKAWKADAIKSEKDTLELDLAAGEYVLKVIVDGDWEGGKVKGFSALTAPAAEGLSADKDDNICFKLAEAGKVKVIYTDKLFKLDGKFYVPQPHYYIAGTMNKWNVGANELIAGKADSLSIAIALEADSLYEFKVVKVLGADTTWFGNEQEATMEYGHSTGWWLKGDKNVGLQTTKAGEYLFIFRANENNEISVVIPEPDPVEQPKFYVTGNKELVGAELEWNPAAIKSMTDTLVLDLKADQNYMMKLTLDGEWNERVLGYDALTEKAEGLTRGEGSDNDNICFSLAEDGKVNVIYFVKDEKVTFKLEGNFYVAPIETAKFYVTGNAAIAGDKEWQSDAIKSMKDTLVLSLATDTVVMRLTLDGTWASEQQRDFRHLTDTAAGLHEEIDEYGNHNIRFVLKEAGDVTIIYNENEFKLIGNFYVDEPQPQTLADGYYLIGQKGWDVAALDASLLFVANADQGGEFKLDVTLKENDHIKVVLVEKDAIKIWYPEGEGNEYVVDKKHAGNKTVYFRPEGNSEWGTFGGFIWIDANPDEGFENIDASQKAVKLIHNGQVVILRGDKVYTVTGQVIQ